MTTVLEVAQDVALRIGISVPDAVFTATSRTELELQEALQEARETIVRAHDWQALKTQATSSGDGSTTDFSLPSDYLRMPKDAQVWSTRWDRPLIQVSPEDDLRLAVREYDLVQGAWTLIGGKMRFRPALATGEDAYYLYISNASITASDATTKSAFTLDDDEFRLDSRLLKLATIWEWKFRKGLPYAEDMQVANIALGQAISDDKGARLLTQSSRNNIRAQPSYPWNLGT